ncbi:hypothetical protein EX895_000571 [Sporisorium graminicola]|uniref:Uncharacterized protein n=1 Tax=Sporisorium graminicola TaxID=280036 RepID=A0A4U7L0E3_9BASI|nr:hypothetical protein EX895_000571 [Sporisorium graminicola]TKY90573.1 hypothetical protein EX895_000571 [Sporisorium graminicola]
MSTFGWLLVAIVAYLTHGAYRRVQLSRKRAEFIRDRRRAAGIPDDDNRPFAEARADSLTRRSQQRRDEALSTPVKKRKNSLGRSKSQISIDHDAASRLSGIPGTLPGYLKGSLLSQPVQQSRYKLSPAMTSNDLRSPSPTKHRSVERSSSLKTIKGQSSQTPADNVSASKADPISDVRKNSPSASTQRSLKRRQSASPTKAEVGEQEQNRKLNRKAQKVSFPGDFAGQEDLTDEEMSDGTAAPADSLDADEEGSEAMDEDDADSVSESGGNRYTGSNGDGPLRALQSAARATAKKREADELEDSDTEGSVDTLDDDESYLPHTSKRSRTVNQEIDPNSPLDFDIAVPEEAMVDFDPVHDNNSSSSTKDKSSGTQHKRQADTSNDRQPGEEWTDFEGLRWRIHPETHDLQRWSDVLEWRSKYHMPRDSLHPMAKESHQVVVHKWLTREKWEEAKAKKLLSFQEPERLAEKEKLDKEEAEKMRRKQELLAKIRQTSSPNKRISSYLAQRQLQHKLSRGDMSGDVSMNTFTTNDADGDVDSMSIDSMSILSGGGDGTTPSKPRSRRISLQSRMTPLRGAADTSTGSARVGRESGSTSGASSPSESPNRRRGSPLASPYRSIAYPKSKKGTNATSSPLVTTAFPPPSTS